MIGTAHYLRFERADRVEETDAGILARLDGDHLRVDVVRPDVLRISISRGGAFDEAPTVAVCVDPLVDVPPFRVDCDDPAGVVRLHTDALVLTLGLSPFRVDVHRTDGSPVVETAVDEEGRPWSYATLNDAFVLRRRCRQEDAFFGLGEKTGRHNRKRRNFTMWNTDVLNPGSAAELPVGRSADDPGGDRTCTAARCPQ